MRDVAQRWQQCSLQTLAPSGTATALDEVLTSVSKSEARIAPLKTTARANSAPKSRHFFAVARVPVVMKILKLWRAAAH
jgi:hypothetical protein